MEWIKKEALESGNEDYIRDVEAIELPSKAENGKTWIQYFMDQRRYVTIFGGARKEKPPFSHGYGFDSREYTLMDKINAVRGILFSLEHLSGELVHSDLFSEMDSVQVPVYFFQGKNDYQTVHQVAKEFYEHIKAPDKAFFEFETCAHNPIFTEPEKFNNHLRSVLNTH